MQEDRPRISIGEQGIVIKTSNRSYVVNYILAILLVILLTLLFPLLNIQFSFFPKNVTEIFGTIIVLGFIAFIGFLLEEPFVERMMRKYIVTTDEVIKVEGVFRRNRIAIPARSVSDIQVSKGIFGRIFNFGDVIVRGFKSDITIKGIVNPNMVYKVIKNKVTIAGIGKPKREEVIVEKPRKGKKSKGRKRSEVVEELPVIEFPEG